MKSGNSHLYFCFTDLLVLYFFTTQLGTPHALTCDTKCFHLVIYCEGIIAELGRVVEVVNSTTMIWILQLIKNKKCT